MVRFKKLYCYFYIYNKHKFELIEQHIHFSMNLKHRMFHNKADEFITSCQLKRL